MRLRSILQKLFTNSQSNIHGAHINFLELSVDAVLRGAKLTCSGLGRYLRTKTTTKHNIKRVDNMLGSLCLQANRVELYKSNAKLLLHSRTMPIISIDWSSVTPSRKFQILRATLVVKKNGGRSLTVYEETHPQSKLGNPLVHKNFLKTLSEIIPKSCKPIITTDAGFLTPWFMVVTKLNWDYIGRIRGTTHYSTDNIYWNYCKNAYSLATTKVKYLGNIKLSRSNRLPCHGYIIKNTPKNRKHKGVMGNISKGTSSLKISKRNQEPWFLVSSLSDSDISKQKVADIYSTRMQIEETFRDTKSITFGMGLKHNRSLDAQRINILLLIGTLAHLVLYGIGLAVTEAGRHLAQQANSIKHKRVISFITLGYEYWRYKFCKLRTPQVWNILKGLKYD